MPGPERINIRADRATIELLKAAASARGMSLTYFVLKCSGDMAIKVLTDQDHDSVDAE